MELQVYIGLSVLVCGAMTFGLRLVPFLVMTRLASSNFVIYIGAMMPPAVMVILIVYSVKSVDFSTVPYGMPSMIAIITVVLLHYLWRNPLISIVGGTSMHMFLLWHMGQ